MTKQEEIREGVKDILEKYGVRSLSFKHDDWDFNRDEFAEKLIAYLHSQGVVIKVDRELPEPIQDTIKACKEIKAGPGFAAHATAVFVRVCPLRILGLTCEQCKELAGYVAVEPLIKEE